MERSCTLPVAAVNRWVRAFCRFFYAPDFSRTYDSRTSPGRLAAPGSCSFAGSEGDLPPDPARRAETRRNLLIIRWFLESASAGARFGICRRHRRAALAKPDCSENSAGCRFGRDHSAACGDHPSDRCRRPSGDQPGGSPNRRRRMSTRDSIFRRWARTMAVRSKMARSSRSLVTT